MILQCLQCDPDPDFSTVTYPNPEEGPGALKLAIKTADQHSADVIFANDPDVDRLALAERQVSGYKVLSFILAIHNDREWKLFTGNEMGTMLAYFVWKCHSDVADNSKYYSKHIL
jgi:phosphomannomutase